MDTISAIFTRKSTRNFTGKKVSKQILSYIIEAGYAAPVARGKYNDLSISVVADYPTLSTIEQSAKKSNIGLSLYHAPILIVVSSKHDKADPYGKYSNAGCIIQNMLLAATTFGLDSVYTTSVANAIIADPSLCAELHIPLGYIPVGGCLIGYSGEKQKVESTSRHTINTALLGDENLDDSEIQ